MSFDAGFPHGVGSYSGEVKNGLPDGQVRNNVSDERY